MKEKLYKINGQKLNKYDTMVLLEKKIKEVIKLCDNYIKSYKGMQEFLRKKLENEPYVTPEERAQQDKMIEFFKRLADKKFAKEERMQANIYQTKDFDRLVADVDLTIRSEKKFIGSNNKVLINSQNNPRPYFQLKLLEYMGEKLEVSKKIYEMQYQLNADEFEKETGKKIDDLNQEQEGWVLEVF